eukprot:GHVN01068723.1.p2 GENE.GHVN01068723.1~~GHVN01068723.1.p2  ORF type:complete len:338 (+),score=29.31 GHVN01068723.1:1585-2598(+)
MTDSPLPVTPETTNQVTEASASTPSLTTALSVSPYLNLEVPNLSSVATVPAGSQEVEMRSPIGSSLVGQPNSSTSASPRLTSDTATARNSIAAPFFSETCASSYHQPPHLRALYHHHYSPYDSNTQAIDSSTQHSSASATPGNGAGSDVGDEQSFTSLSRFPSRSCSLAQNTGGRENTPSSAGSSPHLPTESGRLTNGPRGPSGTCFLNNHSVPQGDEISSLGSSTTTALSNLTPLDSDLSMCSPLSFSSPQFHDGNTEESPTLLAITAHSPGPRHSSRPIHHATPRPSTRSSQLRSGTRTFRKRHGISRSRRTVARAPKHTSSGGWYLRGRRLGGV